MGTLTVNGVKIQVDDSFKTLSPEDQEATVNEIAAQIAAGGKGNAPARSGGVDGAVRSVARGALGIGSYLDELDAATNATLAPIVDPFLPDSYEKLPGRPGASATTRRSTSSAGKMTSTMRIIRSCRPGCRSRAVSDRPAHCSGRLRSSATTRSAIPVRLSGRASRRPPSLAVEPASFKGSVLGKVMVRSVCARA